MSGDAFIKLDKLNVCPSCGRRAYIDYMEVRMMDERLGGAMELIIKFKHDDDYYKDDTWNCEPQEESGGYWVELPLANASVLSKATSDELTRKLLEIEAEGERIDNIHTLARWY